MKKMRFLSLALSLVLLLTALSSCDWFGAKSNEFTVTYYDGETVLKTEKVKEGEKAPEWTPTKEGYTFVGWFGEPTMTHKFDFNAAVSADISVFAGFSAESVDDTRSFAIVGSGTSPLLLESNWGKVIVDAHKMEKSADSNVYTITLDLHAGDQFQFAINTSWENQRGYGYLVETTLSDGTLVFSGAGTIGENSAKRNNIKVELAGNYTFTLTTHPADDTYESNHPSYTEEGKENFNINPYDTITWVRNGDISSDVSVVTDFYIKGSDITGWQDVYSPATKMTGADGVYTLSVYLKEGEEFLFTSINTVGDVSTTGTDYLRATNLDEASKAYLDGTGNMTAKASGMYTFTYDVESKVLSVAFDGSATLPEADYYIDGTFADGVADWNGYCFNSQFKLAETAEGSGIYEIKNVALKEGSQIIIQMFKAGATERGEWGTDGYNGLGSFNYFYLVGGGENFSAVGDGNNNIKVLVGGNYDITFNEYTKVMTITKSEAVVYDVFIKGGMNAWEHAFSADYQLAMDGSTYEITLTFEKDWEFGLVGYLSNAHTGYGDWIGKDALGTDGDANNLFVVEGSHNLKCAEAGTYRIVYDHTAGTINIYRA